MNKLDAAFDFNQSVLRVRSQRQEVLAANIANADTPNYKARDIDFKASLEAALSGKSSSTLSAAKTSEQHLDAKGTGGTPTGLPDSPLFRPTTQGSIDGNTVDMDVERNQFTDNAIRYEASLTMLNGQIKKMLAAIQGQ